MPREPNPQHHFPVIIFDGLCSLCSNSVQFVLKRDHKNIFYFVANQSKAGLRWLQQAGLTSIANETIVLFEGGRAYTRSTAILRIFRILGFPWNILSLFLSIPEKWRDAAYAFIANRRTVFFKPHETCWIPKPEWRTRFIED